MKDRPGTKDASGLWGLEKATGCSPLGSREGTGPTDTLILAQRDPGPESDS